VYWNQITSFNKTTTMTDLSWWETLNGYEKIYWAITIPATLLLVIVMISSIFGGDADDVGSGDAEVSADDGLGFQFFTLKNVVGFFAIFGWSGLACLDGGMGTGVTLFVSVICGLLMMVVMASLFYFIMKMSDSGTLNLRNAVGSIGEVYLPISNSRKGFGKVQVTVQGQMRTLQALTDDEQDIEVGAVIRVVDIINENILLVTK